LKDDPIPPEDHFTRWCKPSHVDVDVIGVDAFLLEEKDTDNALSVNWLEFLNCADRASEIAEIQRVLSSKLKKVSKNSLIAVLNVSTALAAVDESLSGKLALAVLHNPARDEGKWDDPSHSSIYGLTRDQDAQTAATALRDAIAEVHAAASSAV
jgi:hypothetical protein